VLGTGVLGTGVLGIGCDGFLAALLQPPAIRLTPINNVMNMSRTDFDVFKQLPPLLFIQIYYFYYFQSYAK
jgi:hypothetical protein